MIEEYVKELCEHVETLAGTDIPDLSLKDKARFLADSRQAFGRTALMLSGGGSMGML
jgi:hypothetical protein